RALLSRRPTLARRPTAWRHDSTIVVGGGSARRSVHEHDFAEPRRNVRPRLGVLRIGPDAHAPVRLDAIPTIEIHFPDRAYGWWTTRQLLEIRPRNHGLEAPAAVGVGADVQRPAEGRRDLHAGG